MGDDFPNAKAAARNKHRQNNSQKDKSKFKAKQAADKAAATSADNKAKKQPPAIDLKTTILNISAPELEEFSRRELTSNWQKYEESVDTEEHEQNSAYDFAELLQMPKSVGGHFQFAAEKKWESSVDEEKKYSKFFHLDTNILNCGLLTIPFYERQGYDKDLFSSGDIIKMNIEADTHKAMFDQLTKQARPKEEPARPVKAASNKAPTSDRTNTLEKAVKQMSISPAMPPEKAEIQQWLDDILDD